MMAMPVAQDILGYCQQVLSKWKKKWEAIWCTWVRTGNFISRLWHGYKGWGKEMPQLPWAMLGLTDEKEINEGPQSLAKCCLLTRVGFKMACSKKGVISKAVWLKDERKISELLWMAKELEHQQTWIRSDRSHVLSVLWQSTMPPETKPREQNCLCLLSTWLSVLSGDTGAEQRQLLDSWLLLECTSRAESQFAKPSMLERKFSESVMGTLPFLSSLFQPSPLSNTTHSSDNYYWQVQDAMSILTTWLAPSSAFVSGYPILFLTSQWLVLCPDIT